MDYLQNNQRSRLFSSGEKQIKLRLQKTVSADADRILGYCSMERTHKGISLSKNHLKSDSNQDKKLPKVSDSWSSKQKVRASYSDCCGLCYLKIESLVGRVKGI